MPRVLALGQLAAFALALLASALIASAGPLAPTAVAACGAPPAIDDAVRTGEIVFVGTVTSLDNDNRWAVVTVEERWRDAASLPSSVRVHGGPEPGSATGDDRAYERRRYLFVVGSAGDHLADNACSATRPWTGDLARLRPDGVPPVAPGPIGSSGMLSSDDVVVVAALVGFLLVAIVAYILILRRRQRPPDWRR